MHAITTASDAYVRALASASSQHPGAPAIASAMSAMEQTTRTFLGGLRQIQFPDGAQEHVRTLDTDSQTLANTDLLLVNEAANLNRTDVAAWNRLDSQWRADDKQLRTDLGLAVPDFDNH